MVQTHMLAAGHHGEILRTVVEALLVDVVHVLGCQQRATQRALHDESVLIDVPGPGCRRMRRGVDKAIAVLVNLLRAVSGRGPLEMPIEVAIGLPVIGTLAGGEVVADERRLAASAIAYPHELLAVGEPASARPMCAKAGFRLALDEAIAPVAACRQEGRLAATTIAQAYKLTALGDRMGRHHRPPFCGVTPGATDIAPRLHYWELYHRPGVIHDGICNKWRGARQGGDPA